MSKIAKTFSIGILSVLLSFFSYQLCYFVAEKYFFDKFFFFKSISHGYFVPGSKNTSLKRYGERSIDITALNLGNQIQLPKTNYKIIVIGDSLVCGQGIRNSQRFVRLLSDKLNLIKPTTVISLAMGGDNIFDNYKKYVDSQKIYGDADLYIFSLFNNDLLLNTDDRYHTNSYLDSLYGQSCKNKLKIVDGSDVNLMDTFNQDTYNYCLLQKIVSNFPSNKSIYLNMGSLVTPNWPEQVQTEQLFSKYFTLLSIKNINNADFLISYQEFHPNSTANYIYSNVLFNEITTNPQWNFTKK